MVTVNHYKECGHLLVPKEESELECVTMWVLHIIAV